MKELFDKIKNRISRLARELFYSFFPDELCLNEIKKLRSLSIETTNICNANCVFCGYQYMQRKKEIMNDETFKKIISEFVETGGGNLNMTVIVGDPLIDPQFVERIRHARSFSSIKKISTITNGLNLHKVGIKNILLSGLDEILISMTGFDEAMFKRIYRSNTNFNQMKQNILELLRTNHELGKPVKISLSLRIDEPLNKVINYPGFKEIVALADSINSNYYYDSWGGRITPDNLPKNMKIRPTFFNFLNKKNPCFMLYLGIGILVDGKATACPCRDLNGDSDLVIGNINKSSLYNIYNSEALEKLRNKWREGKYIPNICKDCNHYSPYTYLMLREIKTRNFTPEL
jgi:radical SAM protein with 4Fe4S-binding SPASM domain